MIRMLLSQSLALLSEASDDLLLALETFKFLATAVPIVADYTLVATVGFIFVFAAQSWHLKGNLSISTISFCTNNFKIRHSAAHPDMKFDFIDYLGGILKTILTSLILKQEAWNHSSQSSHAIISKFSGYLQKQKSSFAVGFSCKIPWSFIKPFIFLSTMSSVCPLGSTRWAVDLITTLVWAGVLSVTLSPEFFLPPALPFYFSFCFDVVVDSGTPYLEAFVWAAPFWETFFSTVEGTREASETLSAA